MRSVARLIHTAIEAHRCDVCGARARFGAETCDGICARAKAGGRDRGQQVKLETIRDNARPYPTQPHTLEEAIDFECNVVLGYRNTGLLTAR